MKQMSPSFTPVKALCAAALFGSCAVSAQAQTSVTIYGRVVAGIDIQSNVHQANGNTGTQ
ncbi:porin, partial [Herbaspirillum lusitanum]